jgi:hypothetical protein
MKKIGLTAVLAAGVAISAMADGSHSLGFGLHYWRTIDELDVAHGDLDESGVAWVASYRYAPATLIQIEADLEVFPEGFGGADETAYAPQVYLMVGSAIYAALGVGVVYSPDFTDDFSDPFYQLRAGLDLELLPKIHVDVNANYQFFDWDLDTFDDNIDTDSVTLGASVRIEL